MKTKSAVAQSVGVAVATRNSVVLPWTAQTSNVGSFDRHDTDASVVTNAVSCPAGVVPLSLGTPEPLTFVSTTAEPFH